MFIFVAIISTISVVLFFSFYIECERTDYLHGEVYWCVDGYTCTWDHRIKEHEPDSNCNKTDFWKSKTLLNIKDYNNRKFEPFYDLKIFTNSSWITEEKE